VFYFGVQVNAGPNLFEPQVSSVSLGPSSYNFFVVSSVVLCLQMFAMHSLLPYASQRRADSACSVQWRFAAQVTSSWPLTRRGGAMKPAILGLAMFRTRVPASRCHGYINCSICVVSIWFMLLQVIFTVKQEENQVYVTFIAQ
jgi:hypothetical protein